MPGLIWNMMMSMSGGWFFVVASEAITVGDKTITLPGIGAYLAQATAEKNLAAVGWVVLAMTHHPLRPADVPASGRLGR
jgi:NitT/TauT family transport system permease protein